MQEADVSQMKADSSQVESGTCINQKCDCRCILMYFPP